MPRRMRPPIIWKYCGRYVAVWLASETVGLHHFARLAQRVGRARMLLMQEDRKLRSYGLTLGSHRLLKQAILHPFRQMAPAPDNSLAQGTRKLLRHHAGDRPHGCHSSRKNPTCQRATKCQVPLRRPAFRGREQACTWRTRSSQESCALKPTHLCPISVARSVSDPGEPRVRIPVKRFLACPLTFTDNPNHAGVSYTIRDMGLRRRSPWPSRTIESLFIDLFS
jgi:hypothetical protein